MPLLQIKNRINRLKLPRIIFAQLNKGTYMQCRFKIVEKSDVIYLKFIFCSKPLSSVGPSVPFVPSRFSFLYSHDQYHKYYLHKLAQYSEQPGRTAAG
jgi:hypothetical protein